MSHRLNTAPLRLARYLLARLLPTSQRNAVLGDLDEEYVSTQLPRLGRRRANWWYAREAILALAFVAKRGKAFLLELVSQLYALMVWSLAEPHKFKSKE